VGESKTDIRRQILEVAAELLEREGAQGLSTRAVAAAAGIQPPALYRWFGDKEGLLAALAGYGFEKYLAEKQALRHTDDPVADLHRGWDMHVDFGLRHPAFYVLMYGTESPERRPPAVDEATKLLLRYLARVAEAGRLRVPADLAARMLLAATTGTTLALIGAKEGDRDLDASHRMRDTVIASVTTDTPAVAASDLASRALALDAALSGAEQSGLPLRATETALLRDWLRRLAK
jgi:AcrR family transcriptional regulator